MIIKSSQRAGHRELAAHLMKERDIDGTPQTVTVTGSRDLITGDNVYEALDDMALMAQASDRCLQDIHHVSMSPAHFMDAMAWEMAWDVYEHEFGLAGQPFIEVTHTKGDRPPHKHRAYERVNVQTSRAVTFSQSYVRNEKIARFIEYTFSHELTIGKHNRSVMQRFKEDGELGVVAWMEAGQAHTQQRPSARQTHKDVQQEKRTRLPTAQVINDLEYCFEHTDNGAAFEAALGEKGYVLARGDRRKYVVIDFEGGVHSPRRRLGVKAKVLREKWRDLKPENLPTVSDVTQKLQALKEVRVQDENRSSNTVSEEADVTSSDTAGTLADHDGVSLYAEKVDRLREEELSTQELITALEQKIESQHLQEELNYWQRQAEAELERVKPRQSTARRTKETSHRSTNRGRNTKQPSNVEGQSAIKSMEQLLRLQGSGAIAERQRRLQNLQQPVSARLGGSKALQSLHLATAEQASLQAKHVLSAEKLAEVRGVTDYCKFWQDRFNQELSAKQGTLSEQRGYRLADRWISERLARKGYSRQQAQRILLQASPEVMNQRPSDRLRYVRQTVNKVYRSHERQIYLDQKESEKLTEKER